MCGIAGILDYGNIFSGEVLAQRVESMSELLKHRGPDDNGLWSEKNGFAALAHRRLSILDLSNAGQQPMTSEDNSHIIVFNGEIYNHLEIRKELELLGETFKSSCDTEVLLKSYLRWGKDCIKRFDGMFAFLILNPKEKKAFIARDPFGEKPFYYSWIRGSFVFSSELKPILNLPEFDAEVSIDQIAEYLCLQYVDGESSFYKNAFKVEPGHWAEINERGEIHKESYFEFNPGFDPYENRSLDDLTDELEELLVRSIKRRLVSDVPIGAFLSGGVDSSTVVALISKKLNLPIKTFSIGFENTEKSEHVFARKMAMHLGSEHYEKVLPQDYISQLDVLGKLIDEPNADNSFLPTYELSKFAREKVTVAISGDGADELFGGYHRYHKTMAEKGLHTLPQGNRYYSNRFFIFDENELSSFLPNPSVEFFNKIQSLREEINTENLLANMRKSDVKHYLPGAVLAKVDRMSMAHGLEVRTPFLNHEIAAFAEKIPEKFLYYKGKGKIILKNLASRYIPKNWLERRKTGFGIPMQGWGDEFLKNKFSQKQEKSAVNTNWWYYPTFENRLSLHKSFNNYQLWALNLLSSYFEKNKYYTQIEVSIEKQFELEYLLSNINKKSLFYSNNKTPDWVFRISTMETVLTPHTYIQPSKDFGKIIIEEDFFRNPEGFLSTRKIDELPETAVILVDHYLLTYHFIRSLKKYFKTFIIFQNNIWHINPKPKDIFDGKKRTYPDRKLFYNSETQERITTNFKQAISHLAKAFRYDFSINLNEKEKRENMFFSKHTLYRKDTAQRTKLLVSEIYNLMKFKKDEIIWFLKFQRLVNQRKNISGTVPTSPKKNNILLVIHSLSSGGAERQVCLLAKHFKKVGMNVGVYILWPEQNQKKDYLNILKDNKIIIHTSRTYILNLKDQSSEILGILSKCPKFLRKDVIGLYNFLIHIKPSIVYSFLDHPNLVSGVAGVIANSPKIIFSFRNKNPSHFHAHRSWHLKYYRTLVRSSSIILSGNSESGNIDYANWLGIPSSRITLLPNIIDFEQVTEEQKFNPNSLILEELNISKNDHVIGGVFRLSSEKCPFIFIKVIRNLVNRYPTLKVFIIGEGPLFSEIKSRINEHGLKQNVQLLGRKDDIFKYYPIFSLLLLTSSSEGTPNVIMEANACGIPVVSTDSGDQRSIINHGKTGFINQVNDIEALTKSCVILLENKELRNQMGLKAKQFMVDNYDASKQIKRIYSFCTEK